MESITGRLFVGGAFLPKRMLFFRFCLKKVDYSRIYIEKNIDSDKIHYVYMLYLLRKEKNMDKRRIAIFSNELRRLLNSQRMAEVINRINQANLSQQELEFLFECLHTGGYDETTDSFILCESDNSAFLSLVNMVESKVNKKE